jgi:hypothetical protein
VRPNDLRRTVAQLLGIEKPASGIRNQGLATIHGVSRNAGGPAQLGADNVVRFADTSHFLSELAGNLGRGRAFVKTKRKLDLQSRLAVRIEAPGVAWGINAEATVVFVREGFVGLELVDFEEDVLPKLDRLAEEAARNSSDPNERTVIGPLPNAPESSGAADVHIEDDERTGAMFIPPDLAASLSTQRLRTDSDLHAGEDGTLDEEMADEPILEGSPRKPSPREETQLSAPPEQVPSLDARASPSSETIAASGDATIDLRSVKAEPAAPSIVSFGEDALESKELSVIRSTTSGIVRLQPADAAGLYLAQIRHKLITLYGGPDGERDQTVKLKLALAERVVTLDGKIIARVGGFVTIGLGDIKAFEEALRDQHDQWKDALANISRAPAKTEPVEIPSAEPPRPIPTRPPLPPAPSTEAAPPTPTPMPLSGSPGSSPAAGPISSPTQEPLAEDDGPPRVAKLNGDVVLFARVKDLRHEIDTNLKNGGLFVESQPLTLRQHRSLRVSIAGAMTAVTLEVDVVFASGGRVGFSVMQAAEAKSALERAMESVPSAQPKEPAAAAVDSASIPKPQPDAPSFAAFSGKVTKPYSMSELMDYQSRRPKAMSDLAQTPMLAVFEYITRNSGRGVLTVKSGDSRLNAYFHEGSVAYVESQPFDEATSLGRILISSKKTTEAALREALERAKQQKKPLGRMLVALGTVSKKGLSEALRDQTREKIDQTFAWREGTYEWSQWREPPGDADLVLTKGIGIFARYVRSCFENVNHTEIEAMFSKHMSRSVVTKEAVDNLGSIMGLQQKDQRFVEMFLGGERTIAEAVTGSPIGRLASFRLIAAGISTGLFQYKDGRTNQKANAPLPRATSDKESTQITRLKRDLKQRIDLFKGMNYFEVLGVHWSAHHRAYRAAYEKSRREFDLTRSPYRDSPPEITDLAREVLKVLETAYVTLSNEQERISYRKQLFDKTERQYSADMLVKQGEVALMRGDRMGAIEALETAVELDPSARNRSLLASAREGKA